MQLSSAPRVATTRSGWCAAIWVSTASSPARHRWCTWRCAELSATAEARELWVIVNHWKSKNQDTPTVKYTLPRRIEQAKFVSVEPIHINADYPNAYADVPDTARRSSDHDPAQVRFRLGR